MLLNFSVSLGLWLISFALYLQYPLGVKLDELLIVGNGFTSNPCRSPI